VHLYSQSSQCSVALRRDILFKFSFMSINKYGKYTGKFNYTLKKGMSVTEPSFTKLWLEKLFCKELLTEFHKNSAHGLVAYTR
jgi:hypothetical protein